MSSYKEIVTKAVIGKGKKLFTTDNTIKVSNLPSTILGCWVINHNFQGQKNFFQIFFGKGAILGVHFDPLCPNE